MKRKAGILACSILLVVAGVHAQASHVESVKDESTISYHMSHPLHDFDAVSKEANYQVDLDPQTKEIRSVSVRIDVTSFNSGDSNRDSHAMEAIDAMSFPDVVFASSGITQTGDSLRVSGNLTFHGITKPIAIPVMLTWSQMRLDVRGGFDIKLSDFKIERPSLLLIPVKDDLKFSIVAAFRW